MCDFTFYIALSYLVFFVCLHHFFHFFSGGGGGLNIKSQPESRCPELLANYCDMLLRKTPYSKKLTADEIQAKLKDVVSIQFFGIDVSLLCKGCFGRCDCYRFYEY